MKRLEWSQKLSLGVPQIDKQHQRLVQLANNLVAAIQTDMADDILEALFKELREYTMFHFQDEELYMQEVGYPEHEAHAKIHAELKQQVRDYQQALVDNQNVSPDEVLVFLKGWLVDHIIYKDMEIARFVSKRSEKIVE